MIMQGQQQRKNSVIVYVRMQLEVGFGRALYVVGSTEELGSWNIAQAIRLTWTEGNIWLGSFTVAALSMTQYKFAVSSFDWPTEAETTWEGGSNRLLSHQDPDALDLYLNEKWNHQRVVLELITGVTDPDQQLFVIGNSVALGLWMSKRYMTRRRVFQLETGESRELWSTDLEIEKDKEYIHYYYIKKLSTGSSVREREPGRYLYLEQSQNLSMNFYNRFSVVYRPGEIVVVEADTFERFQVSKVTENIFLGAYPKFEKEIADLKNLGIKAVLSLQSRRDLRALGIDSDELRKVYERYGIQAYTLEILDMKPKDFINRSQQAVRLLKQLIQKHGTVYVHCTAGIYRSPQLVVLYLIQYGNLPIDKAISFVKAQRPCAQPHLRCIELSLMRRLEEEEEQGELNNILTQSNQLLITRGYFGRTKQTC